jgi:hypothetical protein
MAWSRRKSVFKRLMNAENYLEKAKKCVQEGDECRKLFGAEEKLFSKGG